MLRLRSPYLKGQRLDQRLAQNWPKDRPNHCTNACGGEDPRHAENGARHHAGPKTGPIIGPKTGPKTSRNTGPIPVAVDRILALLEAEPAERRLDKTRAIKQGMMQQLLTGEIRLPIPATAVEREANP